MTGDSLAAVTDEIRGCTRCRLALTRTRAVPGEGDPEAALVLVGEAPGATEDACGRPFQGLSGRFLDRELAALGLRRDRGIHLVSVARCRPPGNRDPRPDEAAACAPYLDRQLALIQPRVVLAMGGTAARRLHPRARSRATALGGLRGDPVRLAPDRLLLVTYHPAAAMRFPAHRAPFRTDLHQAARRAGLVV